MLMPRLALAKDSDVQLLLQDCRAPTGSQALGICEGYISGVGATMVAVAGFARYGKDEGMIYFALGACGLATATVDAEVRTFINWAEKNPKQWGSPTSIGVMNALSERWPCHRDNQTSAPSH